MCPSFNRINTSKNWHCDFIYTVDPQLSEHLRTKGCSDIRNKSFSMGSHIYLMHSKIPMNIIIIPKMVFGLARVRITEGLLYIIYMQCNIFNAIIHVINN